VYRASPRLECGSSAAAFTAQQVEPKSKLELGAKSTKANAPPPHSKLPFPSSSKVASPLHHSLTSAGGAKDISPARERWVRKRVEEQAPEGRHSFPASTHESIRHPLKRWSLARRPHDAAPNLQVLPSMSARRHFPLYRYSSQNLGPSRPSNWQLLRISSVITRHEFSALHGGCVPGETCRHCSTSSRARSSPMDRRHSRPW